MIFGLVFRNVNYSMMENYKQLSFVRRAKINLFFSFFYSVLFFSVLMYIFIYLHLAMSNGRFISPLTIFNIETLGNAFLDIIEYGPAFSWLVVGIVLFIFFKWINPLIIKFVAYFASGTIQIVLERQRKLDIEKNQKIYEANALKSHNQEVQRIRDIEKAKAEGQAEAMLKMYKGQLALLEDHKKRGLDIERETLDLRKKLLELESEENAKMINDILKTLDRM